MAFLNYGVFVGLNVGRCYLLNYDYTNPMCFTLAYNCEKLETVNNFCNLPDSEYDIIKHLLNYRGWQLINLDTSH